MYNELEHSRELLLGTFRAKLVSGAPRFLLGALIRSEVLVASFAASSSRSASVSRRAIGQALVGGLIFRVFGGEVVPSRSLLGIEIAFNV